MQSNVCLYYVFHTFKQKFKNRAAPKVILSC